MDAWQNAEMYARYAGTLKGKHIVNVGAAKAALDALERGSYDRVRALLEDIQECSAAGEALKALPPTQVAA